MLSRVAANLFWLGRYAERAENAARLVDVTLRLASLPTEEDGHADEGGVWHSALVSAGCEESFYADHATAEPDAAVHHLVFDRRNPSSIVSCIEAARRNARAVRTALTVNVWEALNTLWLDFDRRGAAAVAQNDLPELLDWVKFTAMTVRGAATDTMLRSDAYWFLQLGHFIERGDNTARILDVKYHVLLPEHAPVGSAVDYFQWSALLRALSAARTYGYVYREPVRAKNVAELVILRAEMPRSLAACTAQVDRYLLAIASDYGQRHRCQDMARDRYAKIRDVGVDDVFAYGLHEFLTDFIEENVDLSSAIAEAYLG